MVSNDEEGKSVSIFCSFTIESYVAKQLCGNGILVDDNYFACCCWLLLRGTVIKLNVEDKVQKLQF
jgi:hypothetical protein